MPVTMPDKRFAYWNLYIDGKKFNEFRKYISAITVEYSLNDFTKCYVDIESINYLEDILSKGRKIEVEFGWSPMKPYMRKMFSGEIDVNPEGSADDFMRYTISALDKSIKISRKEKVRTFPSLVKSTIVTTVIGEEGFIPNVSISDMTPISVKEQPMMDGQTAMEFLLECAAKWDCAMWIDGDTNTINFVDASKVNSRGDSLFTLSPFKGLEDLGGKYSLGYKTDYAKNNVAKVEWKFGKSSVSSDGQPVIKRTDESGKTIKQEDYVYDFGSFGTFKINPKIIAESKNNPSLLTKVISSAATTGINGNEVNTQYWVRYPSGGNSKTNKDTQVPSGNSKKGISINIDLNKGDPFLRPPRTGVLYCGSDNKAAVSSNLPRWVVANGKLGTNININKVKTQLSDGMIKTSIEATL